MAWPAESGAVARTAVPSANCTLPVGTPAPGATTVTVAVKVTGCPKVDGLAEEARLVVVAALRTVCVSVPELGA